MIYIQICQPLLAGFFKFFWVHKKVEARIARAHYASFSFESSEPCSSLSRAESIA